MAHWPGDDDPFISTAGSTSGTSPVAWQAAAYRASACALARTASGEGSPGPIRRTARQLANRAPSRA